MMQLYLIGQLIINIFSSCKLCVIQFSKLRVCVFKQPSADAILHTTCVHV